MRTKTSNNTNIVLRMAILFFLLLIAQYSNLFATLRKKTTFEQDIKNVELIFAGKVVSTKSVIMDKQYLPVISSSQWTKIEFKITELLKDADKAVNDNQSVIELYFRVGIVDVPNFIIGEDVVLFLYTRKPLKNIPSFIIASGDKYELISSSNNRNVFSAYHRKEIKLINNGNINFKERNNKSIQNDASITPEVFINEIKKILSRKNNKKSKSE